MNDYKLRNDKDKKRKVGRPKTKDIKNTCKNINVAVPITLLNKWEDIKIVHGSNLTGYITKLIEKDMASNYEHYKNIAYSLKNESYGFINQSKEKIDTIRENAFLTFFKEEIPEIYEQLKENYKRQKGAKAND